MKNNLALFNTIWRTYYTRLPVNDNEFDKYMKIITKIRKNNFEFSTCKSDFIELIEIMSETIYNCKYPDDVVDECYDENNDYSCDRELNCCYNLKNLVKQKY